MRKLGAILFTGFFLAVVFSVPVSVNAQTATPPTATPTPYGCPQLPPGAKPDDYPAEWVAMCWQRCYGAYPTATHFSNLPVTPIGITPIVVTPLSTGTQTIFPTSIPTVTGTPQPTPSGAKIHFTVVNQGGTGGYNGTGSGIVSCLTDTGVRTDIAFGTSYSYEGYSLECLGQTTHNQSLYSGGPQFQNATYKFYVSFHGHNTNRTYYADSDFQTTCSGCLNRSGDFHNDGVITGALSNNSGGTPIGVSITAPGMPDYNPMYTNHPGTIYGYFKIGVNPVFFPTATPLPSPSPTGPGPYCSTLPSPQSGDPVVSALPIIYSAGPCPVTIIPSFSFDLPGFPPLWEGFHWANDGLEVCITWVDLGELKVLGWSMAGLLIAAPFIGWVIKLVSRGG